MIYLRNAKLSLDISAILIVTQDILSHRKVQSTKGMKLVISSFSFFLLYVLDLEMKMLNIKENKRITIKGYELKMVDKNVTMKVHVNH